MVIVADDCQDNLNLVGLVLDALGLKYYLANNGKAASDLIRDKSPDLVLLDIVMPHLNGIELNLRLKNNLLTSHIKTLAVTGLADSEHIESMLNVGFNDYIIKPFIIENLEAKIKCLLDIE